MSASGSPNSGETKVNKSTTTRAKAADKKTTKTEVKDGQVLETKAAGNKTAKTKTAKTKTAKTKTAKTKTAKTKTAKTKTAKTKTAKTKTAKTKTAKTKTAKTKTAKTKTAKTKAPEKKAAKTKTAKTEAPEKKTAKTKTAKTEAPEKKAAKTKTAKTEAPEKKTAKTEAPEKKAAKTKTAKTKTTETEVKKRSSTRIKAPEKKAAKTKAPETKAPETKPLLTQPSVVRRRRKRPVQRAEPTQGRLALEDRNEAPSKSGIAERSERTRRDEGHREAAAKSTQAAPRKKKAERQAHEPIPRRDATAQAPLPQRPEERPHHQATERPEKRPIHRPYIAPPGSAHRQMERHRVQFTPPGSAGEKRPLQTEDARPIPQSGRPERQPLRKGKIWIAPPGSSSSRQEAEPDKNKSSRQSLPSSSMDLDARPVVSREPPRKPRYRPPPPPKALPSKTNRDLGSAANKHGQRNIRPNKPSETAKRSSNTTDRHANTIDKPMGTPGTRTRRAKQLVERLGEVQLECGPTGEILAGVSVVLIGRNHGQVVLKRLEGLRREITSIDTGWWLLDLGSIDASVTKAQSVRAQVIRVPGGQVEPMQTLDLAMAACGGEIVVFFDAACGNVSVVKGIIDKVKQGAPLALVDARLPGAMAISRKAWDRRHFAGHFDLQEWAAGLGRMAVVRASGACLEKNPDAALLPKALDRRRRRQARHAMWVISQRLRRVSRRGSSHKDKKKTHS